MNAELETLLAEKLREARAAAWREGVNAGMLYQSRQLQSPADEFEQPSPPINPYTHAPYPG